MGVEDCEAVVDEKNKAFVQGIDGDASQLADALNMQIQPSAIAGPDELDIDGLMKGGG